VILDEEVEEDGYEEGSRERMSGYGVEGDVSGGEKCHALGDAQSGRILARAGILRRKGFTGWLLADVSRLLCISAYSETVM